MSKSTDIETIREAVRKRHGGFETASDQEIMDLWRSLSEKTREEYLADNPAGQKLEKAKGKNATDLPAPAGRRQAGATGQAQRVNVNEGMKGKETHDADTDEPK